MKQEIFDIKRKNLLYEINDNLHCRCYRVAAARVRILARMESDHNGTDYDEILNKYRQQYSTIKQYI